ncbi:phage tail protein [Vibrio sp. JC009]|uniref:phage tail protein n=1 Tax=Vibrio sp. JC009 TaxID=2912314 RepID=UPI0023AF5256|nr:phage tail protein [Vibrio sp. JC009]WED23079.1 phage tail protein [Vibrio sp. JC009]
MSTNQNADRYRTYVTQTGFGLEALANQQGTKVDFAVLVVGDGVLPDDQNPSVQTDLINQVRSYPVTIEVDETDPTIWIARAEIPAEDGGFTINEAGVKVTDANGDLYCYARQPGDYKPMLAEGAAKSYTIRLKFIPGNSSVIEAKIDPSVQFATPADLDNAIKVHESVSQFLPYDPKRVYRCGEVCTTITAGEIAYWQWYSNVESLAGKDPLNLANRHDAWTDNTKPFYWIPYTGEQVGMPFFWLDSASPEWAVMEINADLPIAVYWRLARRYPHLVSGETINTGEIRGEFLRVLDQGRGVDPNRQLGSFALDSIKQGGFNIRNDAGGSPLLSSPHGEVTITSTANNISVVGDGASHTMQYVKIGSGTETAPRSVARPMAIAI